MSGLRKSDDLDVRGVAVGAAVVAGGIGFSLLAGALVIFVLQAPAGGSNTVSQAGQVAPRGVRLEVVPQTALREFLKSKDERLESYGWIDAPAGRVHIPIERAMQLSAERGKQTGDRR